MNKALLLICDVLLVAGVIAGCDSDNNGADKSKAGESCASTDDCESGLICKAQVCVEDDTTDGDTTDGDITDGDAADGDTTDGDTTDDEIADGVEDGENTTEDEEMDPDFGLTWVSIPYGVFMMGCSYNDSSCHDVEFPRHKVTVSPFEMTQTEITQGQYEAFSGTNPSYYSDCGDNCPVDSVGWDEAKAFCEAVGGRLPSEAEWEYAARADTTTRFYCGDDPACLDDIAWYVDNSDYTIHPVATKTPNAFGLYDMLGSLIEWVADCYHEDDYTGAPATGEVWAGGDCSIAILRGGSLDHDGWFLRASVRGGTMFSTAGSVNGGFRCAREVQ